MARLQSAFIDRADRFCDRMLDLVDALERKRIRLRVLDQMTGCGTSVGANAYEAAEAVSRKDFCKCLGTSVKELSECRFWIRTSGRRTWVRRARLAALEKECMELLHIMGTMISRSRPAARVRAGRPNR